jgi:hypothetical protein
MTPKQAQANSDLYQMLVGAAYVMHEGSLRNHALHRAWCNHASPLLALLWQEDADPQAREVAVRLGAWLTWLRNLKQPQAHFRSSYTRHMKHRQ